MDSIDYFVIGFRDPRGSYRFPDAEKIKNAIFRCHEIVAYGRNVPGIVRAIADQAAKQFAKGQQLAAGVGFISRMIISDLQQGKDSLDGSELPKFSIAECEDAFLASYIARTLFSCGSIVTSESEQNKREPVESKEQQKTKAGAETIEEA